jgi:hypothetical protein
MLENKIPVDRQNRDVIAPHGSENGVEIVALVALYQYAKHASKPPKLPSAEQPSAQLDDCEFADKFS